MVLEHAVLNVRDGMDVEFLEAWVLALPLIQCQKGFRKASLFKSNEVGTYLLLVEWDSISDHVDGFRKSDEYVLWKELLHRFYDPFPVIRYFTEEFCR